MILCFTCKTCFAGVGRNSMTSSVDSGCHSRTSDTSDKDEGANNTTPPVSSVKTSNQDIRALVDFKMKAEVEKFEEDSTRYTHFLCV